LFQIIYKLSFQSKNRTYAAIAYVGKNSYQLFHENIRDVKDVKFVVNFSDSSVRNGSTNPGGVSQLQYFAEVRNKGDLHAKVYIFDNVALVCSANLSKNATTNIEAGILVEEREEVKEILSFFKEIWSKADPIDSRVFSERLRVWTESRRKRVKHGLPVPTEIVRRLKTIRIKPWRTPIPARLVPAIVFSVGKRGKLLVGISKRQRRDVELYNQRRDVEYHKELVNKHGAVFWSVGWERHYSTEPLNGYMYISEEGTVKYRLKIEKIIQNTNLTSEDGKFIPDCRKDWIDTISTWIKITDIKKLEQTVDPTSMMKWEDHKPIKHPSALQSAVKIVDEFWE